MVPWAGTGTSGTLESKSGRKQEFGSWISYASLPRWMLKNAFIFGQLTGRMAGRRASTGGASVRSVRNLPLG
jgi:hypothetical protein